MLLRCFAFLSQPLQNAIAEKMRWGQAEYHVFVSVRQRVSVEVLTVDDKLFILFTLRMLQFLQWNRLNCHVFSFLQISEFDSAVLSCLLHEHVFARRNLAFISGAELSEHQGEDMERHGETQSLQEIFFLFFPLERSRDLLKWCSVRSQRKTIPTIPLWETCSLNLSFQKAKHKGQPSLQHRTEDGVPQFVRHAVLRSQTTDVKGFISGFQSIVFFARAVLPGANVVERK